MRYAARASCGAPPLAELAALDDAAFRARFSGSPIKRIGRDRFVRNVLYAIGNSGDAALRAVAQALMDDPDRGGGGCGALGGGTVGAGLGFDWCQVSSQSIGIRVSIST